MAPKSKAQKPQVPLIDAVVAAPANMSCSTGWFVTGYYTPGEDEFDGPSTMITIPGVGQDSFPAKFLKHVRIEGWGLTRHGWFLGFDNGWVKGNAPLNARGGPLQIGSLAVDRDVIAMGSRVRIPTLVAPWDTQEFIADDTGGGIIGKHVDVYCGAGEAAHDETLRITADNMQVCLG